MISPPTRPIVRYYGGKWRLAPWIISHFPPHYAYVELYGGGASVLLRKPRSRVEVYNDLDQEMVNLFRTARDRGGELERVLRMTPYAREEYDLCWEPMTEDLERARRTVIRQWFGYATKGTVLARSGFRLRTVGTQRHSSGMEWWGYVEAFHSIIARLQGVVIENHDALRILSLFDHSETLFYADPAYQLDSRREHRHRYKHELTNEDHRRLADSLKRIRGMAVVSGYRTDLYDELYTGWQRDEIQTRDAANNPRTECLWIPPNVKPRHLELFEGGGNES